MNIPVVSFEQLPEVYEKGMGGIVQGQSVTVFSYTETLYYYEEKIEQHFQILAVCKLVGCPHFALHLGYYIQQFFTVLWLDAEKRFFLERVEYIVFQKNVDVITVVCDKGFVKVNDAALVFVIVEAMYLSFGNEEYRIILHVVGVEIDMMFSFARHEPNDLVKAVNMRLLCVLCMAFQIIMQGINLEL